MADKKMVEQITSMEEDFAQWYTDVVLKAELIENFSFLEDWEQRYAYLIELGKELPPMADADKKNVS